MAHLIANLIHIPDILWSNRMSINRQASFSHRFPIADVALSMPKRRLEGYGFKVFDYLMLRLIRTGQVFGNPDFIPR